MVGHFLALCGNEHFQEKIKNVLHKAPGSIPQILASAYGFSFKSLGLQTEVSLSVLSD